MIAFLGDEAIETGVLSKDVDFFFGRKCIAGPLVRVSLSTYSWCSSIQATDCLTSRHLTSTEYMNMRQFASLPPSYVPDLRRQYLTSKKFPSQWKNRESLGGDDPAKCLSGVRVGFAPSPIWHKHSSIFDRQLSIAPFIQLLQIAIRCQQSLPWPTHPRTSRALHRSSLLPLPHVLPSHPEVRATPMKRQIQGGLIPVRVR